MSRELLFVYGTLRTDDSAPEAKLLKSKSRNLGAAVLEGARLFDLGEYPGAVRSDDPSEKVEGLLLEIDPEESAELLARLDAYEEFEPHRPEQSLFIRERAEVRSGNKTRKAWIYWYNGSLSSARAIGSGHYRRRIGRARLRTKRKAT